MNDQWNDKIFNLTANGFEELALEIFRFQYSNNTIYRAYTDHIGVNPRKVERLSAIPFLPIRFFKTHPVTTTQYDAEKIFESSGTTGSVNSRHAVKNIDVYRQSFTQCFELFYGDIADWCILGLLPSYLERNNSSLVFMVKELIEKSRHAKSGFYLNEFDKLAKTLQHLDEKKQKTLLLGVSFALLDFAEQFPMPLQHTVIMETGGMKGRRDELVRGELHEKLQTAFHLKNIHSEYGMTELLSQAYSKGNGIFYCPPWMKVSLRDEEDPLSSLESGVDSQESRLPTPDSRLQTVTGAVNIIDLANIYSCSFIATDDAGRLNVSGAFEILGRLDNSDIRGCSLMAL